MVFRLVGSINGKRKNRFVELREHNVVRVTLSGLTRLRKVRTTHLGQVERTWTYTVTCCRCCFNVSPIPSLSAVVVAFRRLLMRSWHKLHVNPERGLRLRTLNFTPDSQYPDATNSFQIEQKRESLRAQPCLDPVTRLWKSVVYNMCRTSNGSGSRLACCLPGSNSANFFT